MPAFALPAFALLAQSRCSRFFFRSNQKSAKFLSQPFEVPLVRMEVAKLELAANLNEYDKPEVYLLLELLQLYIQLHSVTTSCTLFALVLDECSSAAGEALESTRCSHFSVCS